MGGSIFLRERYDPETASAEEIWEHAGSIAEWYMESEIEGADTTVTEGRTAEAKRSYEQHATMFRTGTSRWHVRMQLPLGTLGTPQGLLEPLPGTTP